MRLPLLTLALRADHDLVHARQRARTLAVYLGFETQDQSRIATTVSELARNALRYARGGRVSFTVVGGTPPQLLEIEVADEGPGIPHLAAVLAGQHRSSTGMGIGLTGTRRLMDQFSIDSGERGTTVRVRKLLPARAKLVTPADAQRIVAAIASAVPPTPLDELEQQNRELLKALDELRHRQDELERLNRELEDTNRGVVALYAELDEKADHLRRADELKSKFLSNMTHEFRTPVSSIIAISRILLDRLDGDLGTEQEHQVRLIQHAAEDLSELVTDLLDLAKVEAGKIVVRPVEFSVADLFAALRGMLRPLLLNQSVALVFEDADALAPVFSDEGKISQVLRNFVSNALKFTERGEVRVSARTSDDGRTLEIAVADTGIGIAPEHLETIFIEFSQLEHPLQRKVRGTGLGLPLARKLATLLGGTVTVASTPGAGSTFTLVVPMRYAPPSPPVMAPIPATVGETPGIPVLVVEDAETDIVIYRSLLAGSGFTPHVATTTVGAWDAVKRVRPSAIVLDVQLAGEDSWRLLARLQQTPEVRDTPVIIVSAIDDVAKGLALGAAAYQVKPVEREWLLTTLRRLTQDRRPAVLVVEDHDGWRETLRTMLEASGCRTTLAATGEEALLAARSATFDAVCLDLGLPDVHGADLIAPLIDIGINPWRILVVTGAEVPADLGERLATSGVRVTTKQDTAGAADLARLRELLFAPERAVI